MHHIDFHVILSESLNDKEKQNLHELHATLGRNFPPYGSDMNGYYILLEEAKGTDPPRHQLFPDLKEGAWALHREHMQAVRWLILQGPDQRHVFSPCPWQELKPSLLGELYRIEDHLHEFPDYSILNLCRLMYSVHMRDVVVSKLMYAV